MGRRGEREGVVSDFVVEGGAQAKTIVAAGTRALDFDTGQFLHLFLEKTFC